jgi:hypothetical protein
MYYDYMLPLNENAIVVEHNSKKLLSATTTTQRQGSARFSSRCDALLMHGRNHKGRRSPKHQK